MLDEPPRHRLDRYVQAWEQADVDEFVGLLSADASFSMPTIPAWYQGRESIRALVAKTIFGGNAAGRWRLLPTQANGQIAFGLYRQEAESSLHHAYGIQVLTLDGDQITDVITFGNPALAAHFHLPATLTVNPTVMPKKTFAVRE